MNKLIVILVMLMFFSCGNKRQLKDGFWSLNDTYFIYSCDDRLYFNDSVFTHNLNKVKRNYYFFEGKVGYGSITPFLFDVNDNNLEVAHPFLERNPDLRMFGNYININLKYNEFHWDSIEVFSNTNQPQVIAFDNLSEEIRSQVSKELFIISERNYTMDNLGIDNAMTVIIASDKHRNSYKAKTSHFYPLLVDLEIIPTIRK